MKNTGIIVVISIIFGLLILVTVSVKNREVSSPMPSASPVAINSPKSEGLAGKWQWSRRDVNGDTLIDASHGEYTISFLPSGEFQAQADCNVILGTYLATDDNTADAFTKQGSLVFQPQPTTIAECGQTSYYNDMIDMIKIVQTYQLTDHDQTLIFLWPDNGPQDYYVRIE